MSERRRTRYKRDQAVSAFSVILARFCEATGAFGAAMVDSEGEAVDYAGSLDPYSIKIAAAEWQLVARCLISARTPGFAETREMLVRASQRSYLTLSLTDGYALVAELPRHCFKVSKRALAEALRALKHEGFESPGASRLAPERERWERVFVRTTRGKRPNTLWHAGNWVRLVVLGRYHSDDLEPREVGYRVRLPSGAELNVVREPLGRWYADDFG